MACTFPRAFGFHTWFESKFGDLCRLHDLHYAMGVLPRKKADCKLAAGIIDRGYFTLGIAAYIAVRIFGVTRYRGA